MDLWLIVIAAGLLTYTIRVSMFVLVDHNALPVALRESLNYVTPAVLAGIIVPAVLYTADGGTSIDATNARVPAILVAAMVAWATRNVWATIAIGMGVLWALQWVS